MASFRKCDVINRGYSGYTSRMLVKILPEILQQESFPASINLAIILIGSNDAVIPELDKRAVPVEEYGRALQDMISCCKEKFSHVVIVTPPPVDDMRWNQWLLNSKSK